jgi:hypothetical protein
MREILNNQSKETLIDFIVEYAENNDDIINAVDVWFKKPEFSHELQKIGNMIDNALDGASEYYHRGGWGYIDFDVSGIIMEINQRAEQGFIKLAFAELELLYLKLVKCFEYQSECEVSDEAENCLEIMADIADKAVLSEDKEYIFRQCIYLSNLKDGKDYGADYEGKLLLIAAKFVTTDNLAELEEALKCLNVTWREEEYKLIRLEIIKKIVSSSAADIFISENLRFPKIRKIAFENALSRKDYTAGEQLCLDALSEENRHYGISPWLYRLFSMYEEAADVKKMTAAARDILLAGDLEYYEKLKSLCEAQASWDAEYPDLLARCGEKLLYTKYMEILSRENECALLLKQVKKHTETIYLYGKILAKEYPDIIRDILITQIDKEAETAYGRGAYQTICSRIEYLADSGYQPDATEMINNYMQKFKRKPAFVDELGKTKKSFQKA